AVAPFDDRRPSERLRFARLRGPVGEVDGPRLGPGGGGAGQGGRRPGRRRAGQGRAGRQAAEGEAPGPGRHGPKRTGTAMGASWVRGSPVTEAVAAWESASDGSDGATSGSRGNRKATT